MVRPAGAKAVVTTPRHVAATARVGRRPRSVRVFAAEPVIARPPVRGFDAAPGFGAVTVAVPAAAHRVVRGGAARIRAWRGGRVTHIVGIHRVHRITFWHVKHLTAVCRR